MYKWLPNVRDGWVIAAKKIIHSVTMYLIDVIGKHNSYHTHPKYYQYKVFTN